MALSFLFGKGKPVFKPAAHQTVEIEFEDVDGVFQSHFVEILDTHKKKYITLASPGDEMNPVTIGPGLPITVSYFDAPNNAFFSFSGQVRDSRDQEFDVDLPKTIASEDVPPRDDSFRKVVAIPVKYQAVRSVHSQVANTHAITPNSLFLKTNLAIPPETPLRVVLEVPNAQQIDFTARAKGSEKDPADNRKHISEVQFEEISEDEKSQILSYAVYYEKRAERADKRGGT
jgi:hypothetical protein